MKKAFFAISVSLSLALTLATSMLPSKTQAQTLSPDSNLNSLLSVDVTPRYPRAYDKVEISLQSFRTDLDRADIAWFLDNELRDGGTGRKSFSFTLGKLGTARTVEIVIKTNTGEIYSRKLVIAPAEVDLMWQSRSYVPPFYQGKALITYQTPVTVVALPSFIDNNGTRIPANSLIYKWYESEDKVFDTQSGYGRSTLTFENSNLIPRHIEVDVKSSDNTFFAHSEIDIQSTLPITLVYEDNPLYGVFYNKALGALALASNEITPTAVPYFFNTTNRSETIGYDWYTNNVPVVGQKNRPSVTFRKDSGATGNANIRVKVMSSLKTLQQAGATVDITFSQKGETLPSF